MILMTRPSQFDSEFRTALKDQKNEVVGCSLLHTHATGKDSIDTTDRDALIFTSRTAVAYAVPRINDRAVKCYGVGPGTCLSLVVAGFSPVIDAGGTAKDLVELLEHASFENALYISGTTVTQDLAKRFPDRISRVIVYKTVPKNALPNQVKQTIESGRKWIAPFFSLGSYQAFEKLVLNSGLQSQCEHGHAVFISSKSAKTSTLPWRKTTVADSPDMHGMINAIRAAA